MVVMMDENIYNLNLDYLILAHELVQAGFHQQAMVSMGLTAEAIELISTLPVNQVKKLARSDVLSFAPRFPASFWKAFLQNESIGHKPEENAVRQLRVLLAKPSVKP